MAEIGWGTSGRTGSGLGGLRQNRKWSGGHLAGLEVVVGPAEWPEVVGGPFAGPEVVGWPFSRAGSVLWALRQFRK